MRLPFASWTIFSLLGKAIRNRKQRKAQEQYRRRRRALTRLHAFDTLEARVVLDGDELPIADFPTVDIRVRSDEQAAIVDTANFTSLAGGYDPDGGSVSIVGGNNPPSQIALMPGQDYSWDYTLADDELNEVTGTITLHGVGNTSPVAAADTHNVVVPFGQTSATVNLADYGPNLGNDSDADGDSLTVIDAPTGTVEVGMYGYDYQYTVDDGYGGQSTAGVHLQIEQAPNQAPSAGADEYGPITIGRDDSGANIDMSQYQPSLGNDTDPEGHSLSIVGSSVPSFTTWLSAGWNEWSYTIADQYGAEATGVVRVQLVTAENQAPAAADDEFTLTIGRDDEEGPLDWADFQPNVGNDGDPDGDSLSVASYEAPTSGLGTLALGLHEFAYTMGDGHGGTSAAVVRINVVNAENQSPTASDADVSLDEDTSTVVAGSDPENDPLLAVIVNGPSHGTVETDALGNVTYTPHENYHGPDEFQFRVVDSFGAQSDIATIRLTINPINDRPEVEAGSRTINEDAAWGVWAFDADDDELSIEIVTAPQHGTLQINGNQVLYTPNEHFHGNDSYQYKASDSQLESEVATVDMTMRSVNDSPTFTAGENVEVSEDSGTYSQAWATDLSAGPINESGQTLTFLVETDRPELFDEQPAIDAAGHLTFRVALDAFGVAAVSVRLRDNGGTQYGGQNTSAASQFTISIAPVNDAPTITAPAEPIQVAHNGSVDLGMPYDDIDDDELTIEIVATEHGTVSQSSEGHWIFTAQSGYSGPASATLRVTDPSNASAEATFHFAVDTPPPSVFAFADTPFVQEGNSASVSAAIIADPLQSLNYTIDWGDGTQDSDTLPAGILSLNRSHVYADDGPSPGNGTASDTYLVTITVVDEQNRSGMGIVSLTISNVAPTLLFDSPIPNSSVDEGSGAVTISGMVLDPGVNDTLTIAVKINGNVVATQSAVSGDTFSYTFNPDDDDLDGQDTDDGPVDTADIEIVVVDDDGGEHSSSGSITVQNVDPTATGGTLGDEYLPCAPPTEEEIFAAVSVEDPGSDVHRMSVGSLPTEIGTHTVTVTVEDDDSGTATADVTYTIVRHIETEASEMGNEAHYDLDGDGAYEFEDHEETPTYAFDFDVRDDHYELGPDGRVRYDADVLANDTARLLRTTVAHDFKHVHWVTYDACTGEIIEEWDDVTDDVTTETMQVADATLTAAAGFAPGFAKADPAWIVFEGGTFVYEQEPPAGSLVDDSFGVNVHAAATYDGQNFTADANSTTFLKAPEGGALQALDDTYAIAENSPSQTVVGTVRVHAEDPSWSLTFEIIEGNDDEAFAIDAATGAITVNDPAALDYETRTQYVLTVRVTAGLEPGEACGEGAGEAQDTATITCDVTDVNEAPVFSEATYSGRAAWHQDAGTTPYREFTPTTVPLTIRADDPEGKRVFYSVKPTDQTLFNELFRLSPTGLITFAKDVHFAMRREYAFTIVASDGLLTSEALVTITVVPSVGVTGDTQAIEADANDPNPDTITVRFVRLDSDEQIRTTKLKVTFSIIPEYYYNEEHLNLGRGATPQTEAADFEDPSFFSLVEVEFDEDERMIEFELRAVRDSVDNTIEAFQIEIVDRPEHNYVAAFKVLENDWNTPVQGIFPMAKCDYYVLDGVTAFVKGPDDARVAGTNPGIDRSDVLQRGFPNCGFMAALLALAESNWEILQDNVIESNDVTRTYTIRLYDKRPGPEGFPIGWRHFTITLDLTEGPMFAQIADIGRDESNLGKAEIWPLLFEKAMYKLWEDQGNDRFVRIRVEEAWEALVGVKCTAYDVSTGNAETVVNTIRQLIAEGATSVSLTTSGPADNKQIRNFESGHAYVVGKINDGAGNMILYNPWGELLTAEVPYSAINGIFDCAIGLFLQVPMPQ